MTERRITAAWLKQMGAPSGQVERFVELYPEGAVLNLQMALAATCSDQPVVNAFLTTREEQIRWTWEAVNS